MQNDLRALWQDIVDKAVPNLPEGSADLWFTTCSPTSIEDGKLVVDVANVFAREQMASRFLDELNKAAQSTGEVSGVCLTVIEGDEDRKTEWAERAEKTVPKPSKSNLNLNPNYEFSSFVVGKSNRLAHAASLAVAETPGDAYNPLFIWGGVGLGKTHLMHAICHYTLSKRSDLNVVYVSSEKFVNEFIQSIRTGQGQEFKSKYRNVDILLIDDIQFMGDKSSSQEEFFHTFDSLRVANKQIVICSDRPPSELRNVEDRLVSRFAWGLVTDIQPPDIETRIAILQKKARMRAYEIPEEVVNFLAQRIPSNIRELEGALNRVIACSELSGESISIDNSSIWLKDVLREDIKAPTTIGSIQSLVAESFEMSVDDLVSSKRTAEIAMARQVAMYLCRELTESSLQHIGQAFRKKDHTTVIHAHKKVSHMVKSENGIKNIVDNIKNKL
ncbi:MAG: chromosomal replication initiator protein DnaA [Synergistaceae bacterium]|nr:chromosomal replication initiator protein DnaA [Synergistaceae bacterium]